MLKLRNCTIFRNILEDWIYHHLLHIKDLWAQQRPMLKQQVILIFSSPEKTVAIETRICNIFPTIYIFCENLRMLMEFWSHKLLGEKPRLNHAAHLIPLFWLVQSYCLSPTLSLLNKGFKQLFQVTQKAALNSSQKMFSLILLCLLGVVCTSQLCSHKTTCETWKWIKNINRILIKVNNFSFVNLKLWPITEDKSFSWNTGQVLMKVTCSRTKIGQI